MPKNIRRQPDPPLWAGQNFLTGRDYIRKLLDLTDISLQDTVLEIGPGKGHITRELLAGCGRVIAIEADGKLCSRLREKLAGEAKLDLRQGDFLRARLPREPYKVFANIPFGLTTAIIQKLTEAGGPSRAWLIVEHGAAKRFAGESLAGLGLRPFFKVRIAARIPRGRFHPQPGVDAALLELTRREAPDLELSQKNAWERFLRCGWTHTLTKKQVSTALRLDGLPPVRDGNVMYVQWLCLFRCWRRFGGGPH